MIVVLPVILAIVITGVPLTAVAIVTVASRQEETARSMAGRAPGRLARAARRLLAFSAVGITGPVSRDRSGARPADAEPMAVTAAGALG